MQLPHRLRPTPRNHLPPPPPTRKRRPVSVRNTISQITRRIKLDLTNPIAQPRESIAFIHDIPIVRTHFFQGFEAMQCASWPQGWDTVGDGVVFESGAAGFSPDGAVHEILGVSREVGDGDGLGGERVDVFGLVAVDKLEDVVCLGFWIRGVENGFFS